MDERNDYAPDEPRVLLAGGGTGGHVFPALAVGEELARRGWSVHWAGRRSSMEEDLVRAWGVPFHAVTARAVVGTGAVARSRALATVAVSAVRCRRMVRRLDPRVVVGTGGYVSVPTVLGAHWAGRPTLLLEPNARAGVANRLLSRWARTAALAHEITAADLRCPSRVTGVPVRRAFFEVTAKELGAGPLHVLVLGGSQGARQLNDLVPAAFAAAGLAAAEVCHQAGAGAVEGARRAWREAAPERVEAEVVPFIDDVPAALDWAHLVVSRAGAITLAEICAAGRASILVPLAAAGAHQLDNAHAVAQAGGAEVLSGEEARAERLGELLGELAARRSRLAEMGEAARSLAQPGAAASIADLVEELGVAA